MLTEAERVQLRADFREALDFALTQEAERRRYSYVEDARGNETRDGYTSATYECALQQTDSTEITNGQSTEVSNWRCVFFPEADVDAEDVLAIDGTTYEVIGPPELRQSPVGTTRLIARLGFVE